MRIFHLQFTLIGVLAAGVFLVLQNSVYGVDISGTGNSFVDDAPEDHMHLCMTMEAKGLDNLGQIMANDCRLILNELDSAEREELEQKFGEVD